MMTIAKPNVVNIEPADSPSVAVSANIPFSPDAPYAPYSRLTVDLARVPADGAALATFSVLLRDSRSNPVHSRNVTLSMTGTNLVLTPGSTITTDADGRASLQVRTAVAQNVTANATINAQPFSATTTFFAGNPSSTQSSVSIDRLVATADGQEDATVTVVVRDSLGNAVPGVAVTLEATGPVSLVVQPVALTDASGVATGTIAAPSGSLGSRTITASANGLALATQVSVEFRAVRPAVARGPTMLTAAGRVCRQSFAPNAVSASKLAIDAGNVVYAVLDCGNATRELEVWTSTDGAQTFRQGGATGLSTTGDTEYAVTGGASQEAFLLSVKASGYTVKRTVNAGATWTTYATRSMTLNPSGGASLVAGSGLTISALGSTGYFVERLPAGVTSVVTTSAGTYTRSDVLFDGSRAVFAADSGGSGPAAVVRIGGTVDAMPTASEVTYTPVAGPVEFGLGGGQLWVIPSAGGTAYARQMSGTSMLALRSIGNLAVGPLTLTSRAGAVSSTGAAFTASVAGPQLFVQYAGPSAGNFSAVQTLTNTVDAGVHPAILASPAAGVAIVTWSESDGRVRYAITAFTP